jgi:hypothetical protein
LIHEEKLGLLESLVLKVLKKWPQHSVTYREANTSKQSIKCNKMCYIKVQKERGSDSKNFGERITEFGVAVEKLRRFEVPGAFLQIS